MNSTSSFIRPCTGVWLILMAFTCITFIIGESGLGGSGFMFLVLGTAVIKVQMVSHYFMGLRHTRWLWRGIVLIWLILVAVLIAIAYLQSIG